VFETLHEPADLSEWLAQPPLAAVMTVPVTARELAAAKALCQAIWDAAHARAARRPSPRRGGRDHQPGRGHGAASPVFRTW